MLNNGQGALGLSSSPKHNLPERNDFFTGREDVFLNEAKLLIVGESETGKSSLAAQLAPDVNAEKPNQGIEVKQSRFKLTDGREITLNIWDFGQKELRYATYQFFFTKRSLYLLVIDARGNESQFNLDYWLKNIEKIASDAPVIIVANKIDTNESFNLETSLACKTLQSKYKNIRDFVAISCNDSGSISLLKNKIAEQLQQLEILKEKLSQNSFKIKTEIEDKKKNYPYLLHNDYKDLCSINNLDFRKEKHLKDLLHDLGTILCFDQLKLKNIQVLNPHWIIEGVYKILDQATLASNAQLNIIDLEKILTEKNYFINEINDFEFSEENVLFILEIMRKFEMCFYLDSNNDKILIPNALRKEEYYTGEWDNCLSWEYSYDLLPNNIIARLIVKMNAFICKQTYWRYGVVLESENKNKALVEAVSPNKLIIKINGDHNSGKEFFRLIYSDLYKIFYDIGIKEKPTIMLLSSNV